MSADEVCNLILNNLKDSDFKNTASRIYPSEWISVNDRLPEKDDEYLTCHCGIVTITSYRLEKGWLRGLGYKITYWMPLPEPPK